MKMRLVVILFCLSYSCNGNLLDESQHNPMDAKNNGTDITDIKMEVSVLKENYHALLQRVYNNENDVAFLKGNKQQLEHELDNTRRIFSCEIEGIRDITSQYEHELNETIHSWTTFNETIQNLSNSVSLLDAKYVLLERAEIDGKWTAWVEEPCSVTCGIGTRLRHRQCSNPYPKNGGKKCTGNNKDKITCTQPSCLPVDTLECYGGWIKRDDFGASYCFSDKRLSWDKAQEQCGTQNSSLADIYSENEAVWVEDSCREHSGIDFWIGGKRDQGIFKWFTHDGQTKNMNYTRWAKDRSLAPSNCVELWDRYQYKWYTYECHLDYNFICKTYL
ncbi:uncharacterized protein [Mytilus edulis]|uniref:uncharacterized protein isoform X2 n=1 Tax=Mytilus edulis TaxID=6550 RepID=UPI0039F06781